MSDNTPSQHNSDNLFPLPLKVRHEMPPLLMLIGFIIIGLSVLAVTGFVTQRIMSIVSKPIPITPTATPIRIFIVLPTGTPVPVTPTPTPTGTPVPVIVPPPTPIVIVITATPAPTATPLPPTATPVPPIIDYRSGFKTQNAIQLNGSAQFVGDKLRLTTSTNWLASSAFFIKPVKITAFTTTFRYQAIMAGADGITLTFQNAGLTAIGSSGSGLGYGNIPASTAIKFDLWSAGNYANTTGIYSNGTYPDQPEIPLQGIDLHSEHVIRIDVNYDGKQLQVQETDEFTGKSLQQNYAGDIAAAVGGTTAYVGFTAATGGAAAIQEILNWSFYS